jgi:hypothetical protein
VERGFHERNINEEKNTMKHMKVLSKRPAKAQEDIPISAMVEFIIAVLSAFTPLLVAKDEQD